MPHGGGVSRRQVRRDRANKRSLPVPDAGRQLCGNAQVRSCEVILVESPVKSPILVFVFAPATSVATAQRVQTDGVQSSRTVDPPPWKTNVSQETPLELLRLVTQHRMHPDVMRWSDSLRATCCCSAQPDDPLTDCPDAS
jgi:hypothetical protein